jgi:type IV pilus assembly protein PilQ|tara:strand:- start:596 stop:2251 length:1656 start_codon:yes stop_codon:yes gene_type:complete
MKYLKQILKPYIYLIYASVLFGKDIPQLLDIYTTEKENSYTLIMEFNNGEFEYVTTETFAPPSVSLLFKNINWDKGNFIKKSNLGPLYQYAVSIPRNNNQKEINKKLQLKLDFTRVPDYLVKIEPPKGNNKKNRVMVTWEKNKTKKPDRQYLTPTNRLPESRVSLNFQAAKLVNVVRMLASQDNLNLIMGEEVQGEVTMNINDVSLETALDAILHVNNYEWFMQDNIIVVQPMITKQVMSGELMTRIFRLNYITGSTVSEAVQAILTPRGKIKALSSAASPDTALGNQDMLMVTDIPTNFALIEGVISSLDIQTKQINIAVKFIETTLKHDEIVGVNWDLRESMSILSGNTDSSNSLDLGYLMIGDKTMNFATLSKPVVSAMLSLLANDGSTKLLQEPQVTTMSNSPAKIVVGTTIPLLVPQGEGSVFGKSPYTYEDQHVNVSLDVLPRVNEEDVISMKIDAVVQAIIGFVGKDQRPMISTRSTNTTVRVNNGETLLIGGLIFDTEQEIVSKVPLLGDIPLIKWLFRSSNKDREQRELLIFITPTVISNGT